MKTPIRLAILAFSLITTLFTLTTQIFTSSSYSASSALLQSRGYLPQSILSWANYGENDNGTSSTTSETIMSLEEKHEIEKSRIKAELERIEKGWSKPEKGQEDKIIIMGKMHDDYTDWVEKELPDWQRAIYTVDALNLSIPLSSYTSSLSSGHYITPSGLNKGREALPYLTYIITNYHNPHLPSTLVFIHPHRDGYPRAWHTDSPGHSQPAALKTLKLDYIQAQGYVNLRCNGDPGCPAEVRPRSPSPSKEPEAHMAAAWAELWPEKLGELPEIIAAPCCAQFAVSRDAVLAQPLEHYVRVRDWLIRTELSDYVSGRVMEYLWHIIFGKEAVSCPNAKTCYCELYGRRCPRGREKNRINSGPPEGVQGVAVFGKNQVNTGPPPGVQGVAVFEQAVDDIPASRDFGAAKAAAVKKVGSAGDLGPDPYVPGFEMQKMKDELEAARALPLPDTPFETTPDIEQGELEATGQIKPKLTHDMLTIPDPRTGTAPATTDSDVATAQRNAGLAEAEDFTFMTEEQKASIEAVMGTRVKEFEDGTVEVAWPDEDVEEQAKGTEKDKLLLDSTGSGNGENAAPAAHIIESDTTKLARMVDIQEGLRKGPRPR